MKTLITFVLAIIGLQAYAQKEITGSGNKSYEQRNFEQVFENIEVEGPLNIVLTQDQKKKIGVEMDDNLQKYVMMAVEGNTLKIKLDNQIVIKGMKFNKIEISNPQFVNITKKGSGTLSSTNNITGVQSQLKTEGSGSVNLSFAISTLNVICSGSGDIKLNYIGNTIGIATSGSGSVELHGGAKTLNIAQSGSGNLDALQLSAKTVNLNKEGSGNTALDCQISLNAVLYGSGSVKYKGPCIVNKEENGSGKVEMLVE